MNKYVIYLFEIPLCNVEFCCKFQNHEMFMMWNINMYR